MIPSAFCTLGFLTSYVGPKLNKSFTMMNRTRYIFRLCFFGTIFGILMVLFFMGGFIGGSLFPDLSKPNEFV